MPNKHTNLFKTSLVGGYTNTDTVITVSDASGLTEFPTKLVIFNNQTGDPADAFQAGEAEIVNATGKNGNDVTIERGQENTSGVSLSDGWNVYQTITADTIDGKEPTFTKNTAFNKDFGSSADTVTEGNDARLSDAREWTADTVTQVEAEAGTDTTRKAWTVQRVWQAINSWWNDVSIAISKVTGLQGELDSKADLEGGNTFSGTQRVDGDGESDTILQRLRRGNLNLSRLDFTHFTIQRRANNNDPNIMVLQPDGGNLGIGKNPTAKLDVDGDIKFGSGTDLQTALDGKADLEGGNTFSGEQDIPDGITAESLPQSLDSGLIGLWRFDENSYDVIVDSSGNSHGFIVGNPVFEEGVSGKALNFDGVDDYVRFNNQIATGNNVSISFWSYVEDRDQLIERAGFFGKQTSDSLHITENSGGFRVRIFGTETPITTVQMDNEQWQHNVFIIEENGANKNYSYYKNGVLRNTGVGTSDVDLLGNIDVGRYTGTTPVGYLDGLVDEVRLYKRVLSEREIKALYLNPSGNGYGASAGSNIILENGDSLPTALDGKQNLDKIISSEDPEYLNTHRLITVSAGSTSNLDILFSGDRYWIGGVLEIFNARGVSSGSGNRRTAHTVAHFSAVVLGTTVSSSEIVRTSDVGSSGQIGALSIGSLTSPTAGTLRIPFSNSDSEAMNLYVNIRVQKRFDDIENINVT